MKALLLSIFLFYGCATHAEPRQNLNLVSYTNKQNNSTYYYKLANQYRGTGYTAPRKKPDMVEYEKKLRYLLPVYGVKILRKDAQIFLEFPTALLFEKGAIPGIIPDAYFNVLTKFVYILLTNKSTLIDIRGYADSWLLAQKRANAIAGYLCLHGVAYERVIASGYMDKNKENIVEITLTPL